MTTLKKRSSLPYAILGGALLALTACESNHKIPDPPLSDDRTVIVYMNADNNLYDLVNGAEHYGALVDINEMESAWDNHNKGSLIVYLNSPRSKGERPKLYKIQHDDNPEKITSTVLKTYEYHDASLPSTLSEVIADVREIAPSKNYALALWSHATGWVPKGIDASRSPEKPVQYTFGSSSYSWGGTEMEIDDLARALPSDIVFDYIASDACYMGGIEVAYELRDKCRYFVASAIETPVDGFEYDLIMKELMSADVHKIVEKQFNYYNGLSSWWATCAMSVVDCSKLERLAAATKSLIENSPRSISSINFGAIQDLGSSYSFRNRYYDLGDFMNSTWSGNAGLAEFNAAMREVVPTKLNTPLNLDTYPITKYSGFSCFIPKDVQSAAFAEFKARFAWSKDSGMGNLN